MKAVQLGAEAEAFFQREQERRVPAARANGPRWPRCLGGKGLKGVLFVADWKGGSFCGVFLFPSHWEFGMVQAICHMMHDLPTRLE